MKIIGKAIARIPKITNGGNQSGIVTNHQEISIQPASLAIAKIIANKGNTGDETY